MMMSTLSQVARETGGRLVGSDRGFAAVSTDTRNLRPGDLFFALRGERFDALEFVLEAERRGAAGAVVEMRQRLDIPQVEVRDSREALADFARAWRAGFSLPVIGVTGSNGKTTVKEMIAAILRAQFSDEGAVLATTGNLNNEIGLPLMVLQLTQQHQAAIFEMGASRAGDIELLAGIAQPAIGVITNSAAAHLEGFGDLDGVVQTKGEIIDSVAPGGCVVLNRDDAGFAAWRRRASRHMVLAFGIEADADVNAREIAQPPHGSVSGYAFELVTPAGSMPVQLTVPGLHNVGNALAAASAALALDVSLETIATGLASFDGVPGRLQRQALPGGITLYDDTYNANPASVAAAISLLGSERQPRWLVLGDMAELGTDAAELHAGIGEMARDAGIDRLLCAGALSRSAAEAYGGDAEWFPDRASLSTALAGSLVAGATLLIKASRSSRLEKIIPEIRAAAARLDEGS
jgi:UDP-N-acetylmuramoyl-tripeptide--D-alanyl-D-alanine ligase